MHPPIAFTGIVLETPLLAESSRFYADHFGLEPHHITLESAILGTPGADRAPVMLRKGEFPRLAALSYAYREMADLDRARDDADHQGLSPRLTADGFAINSPDGTELRFHVGSDASASGSQSAVDRPLYMSHVVLNSREPARLVSFFRDQLGFEISDRYEKDLLIFMKCDQPQHHCLGVAPAEIDGLNHFAMDCGTIDALMRGVSRMKTLGHEPIWGPGRHGPGGNIFCYFEDPSGFVPEYTCDVIQIDDPERWHPAVWERKAENGNVWLSGGPSPRAIQLMSGELQRGPGTPRTISPKTEQD